MAERTLYQTIDKYDERVDKIPTDTPGVLEKTLLRDEYTTRNVKILFVALWVVVVGTSLFWILQQPSTGLLVVDLGMAFGYFVMGATAGLVIAMTLVVIVKSLYLSGRRAFAMASH